MPRHLYSLVNRGKAFIDKVQEAEQRYQKTCVFQNLAAVRFYNEKVEDDTKLC